MNENSTRAWKAGRLRALEARFALRVASHLNRAAEDLPHDIAERLRFGRERALKRAPVAQPALVPAVVARSGRAATLGGPPAFWLRLVSLMPLIMLIVGLVLIQNHYDQELIETAAEIDAALLADELPPAAYRDPGFFAFLQSLDAQ